MQDTWAFLDRRLQDVAEFGSMVQQAKAAVQQVVPADVQQAFMTAFNEAPRSSPRPSDQGNDKKARP